MVKKLVVVGNSLALVIDKPIRRLLNIGRNTPLRVTTEPRRLVVEPIAEKVQPPANERDPFSVFDLLVNQYAMDQERFASLHHRPKRMFAYHGWLGAGRACNANDEERATFRRFHTCLTALQRHASWDDAIAVALHAEPKPGTTNGGAPTMEPTRGATMQSTREPATAVVDSNDENAATVLDASVYAEIDDESPSDGVEVSWG